MSPVDSGFPRDSGVKKRMLPSVTDVVRELAKVVSADPAVLFKGARSVVAEELAKVKQGFEAAPLDVLVKRARLRLERDGEATPVSDPAPPPMPVFPARRPVSSEAQKAAPPARPPAPDEPFENAPSRAELGWEKEIPIQPEDAPFRSAIIPIPHKARGRLEISAPIDAPPKAALEPTPQPAPAPKSELELDLEFAPPPSPGPAASEPPAPKSKPEPPEPAPGKPMPRPAVVSAPAIPLVNPREPEVPEAASRPRREIFEDRDRTQPAMEAFRFQAAERPAPAPTRSSRKGWLVALVSVLAIGAGLTWAVREYVFRGEIVRSVGPAARKEPDVAPPASAEPAPVPTAAPALVAKPAAPSPKAIPVPTVQAAAGPPSGAAVPKGRAAALLTPDWAGKPVVYVLHFSSTKDRESATKEAQKLAAALGVPGHAVEVDLGEKGIWYRVVMGEFADVDAARAFRADLEAKKTPRMGFVYEMRGR
ncbi:MAG: SPOR domain-containing protein [Thermoanaerobaculia bacterium]